MGTIKQFNVATTGPNKGLLRKVTRIDRREAPGVLFLGGPAHPAAPAAEGAANSLRVRNAMWKNAQALTGSGDESTLGSSLLVGPGLSGAKGLVERTGKGGIHAIVSQAQTLSGTSEGAAIQLDSALRAYMHANRTDQWYVSLWARFTRDALWDAGLMEIGAGSTSQDYMIAMMRADSGVLGAHTVIAHGNDDGTTQQNAGGTLASALVPVRRWGAVSAKPVVVQGSPWPRVGPSWGLYGGTFNHASAATAQNKLPSYVFYELFIDNLTKSGRTWQEANSLDHEAFVSAFGPGGRYAADTFTDPATLP